jgi:50S ribosomal protein L16 3-hydroxylase
MIAQSDMDIDAPKPLLGGLSPAAFMRRHWQKKPLLVRQALPGATPPLTRSELFDLATHEEAESRVIVQRPSGWTLRHGPLPRSALPPLRQAHWTLLVQGLDLHVTAARELMERFRFVPDARLDDLMVSFATDGGGVGPHVDSYDVFLLQVAGQRRWRIAPLRDPALLPGVPLKILAHFEAEQEWLLDPGDMLYLPPGWAHDGVAVGECMTCSIGFRAEGRSQLARDVLQRLLDGADDADPGPLYRDPTQPAVSAPARIPADLGAFAAQAVARLLREPKVLDCALGELLSEPKRGVWFDAPATPPPVAGQTLQLDLRTRMLYDARHVFINGESFLAAGADARAMRRLADTRKLPRRHVEQLSPAALELLGDWLAAGWLHVAVDA